MRKILLLLLVGVSLHAQSEFKDFENGLIYSPEAIAKLQEIVGGKNEEFRKCDLTKEFLSIPQTKGFYIVIEVSDTKDIEEELKANISLESFISKYAPSIKPKASLIIKTSYVGYDEIKYISISEEPNKVVIDVKEQDWEKSFVNNWILDRYEGKIVGVMYLQSEFKSSKLPYKYSRMVQYAECMIDSTTQIHPKEAKRSRRRYKKDDNTVKRDRFYGYIEKEFGQKEPEFGKNLTDLEYEERAKTEEYKQYRENYKNWKTSRVAFIEDTLSKRPEFKELLEEAYNEAVRKKNSGDLLESYISKYISEEKALTLKRNRIVVGSCSQDISPRIHAMNIAQLSAESYHWDIFLRAHLNVMNDRFSRMSDGSYAWAQRKTYIKELEVLSIDVPSLIYGISLRIDNPSKNHYFGSIRRTGRAIAESKDKEDVENQLLEMIKDDTLDAYNRLLVFYLYHNFQYNLGDSYDKEKIKSVAALLPEYIIPEVK